MSDEQPMRTPVLPGVRASLAAMDVRDVDAGAASLAVRYAELMDEAVAAQKYATALRTVGKFIDWNIDNAPQAQRQQIMTAWDRISSALAEHSVASDLGPKLQNILTGLQLTPAARAAAAPKGEMGRAGVIELENPLKLLQDESRGRWNT